MLERNEFNILNYLQGYNERNMTMSLIADKTKLSLGIVDAIISDMLIKGFIDHDYCILEDGYEVLKPYKVKNALIMAAGMSSRFVPISCEKPKGLLEVKGEVLIERQIKQLNEAGVKDVYIVVGYMMEQFFYLEEKYGVTIIVNCSFGTRNNHGSLYAARHFLGNTYICSSDNYFTENVFETYVYNSYYAAVYFDHESTEAYVNLDSNNRILNTFHGGKNHWAIIGHAYLSDLFCKEYVEHLVDLYDIPETRNKYWEEIFYPYLDHLEIYARKYPSDIIYEFDSLDDLKDFDTQFVNNLDSSIMLNICEILKCRTCDIIKIHPVTAGQTNTSFAFSVRGKKYIYRHPGALTDRFINRKSEGFSCQKAKELGLDKSLITLDDLTGYKLSFFLKTTHKFDFCSEEDVKNGLKILHRLHDARIISPYDFNYMEQINKIYQSMNGTGRKRMKEFDPLRYKIALLNDYIEGDGWQKCLCHGDIRAENFLISQKGYFLIDWEYSGNNDIGYDISRFCSKINDIGDLSEENIVKYFGKEITKRQYRHIIACYAVAEFYWFVWAVNLAGIHKPVEDIIFTCYQNAKKYSQIGLELYQEPLR